MKIYPWIRAARIKTLVASIVPILSSIAILPNIKQVNITILALTISAALIETKRNKTKPQFHQSRLENNAPGGTERCREHSSTENKFVL